VAATRPLSPLLLAQFSALFSTACIEDYLTAVSLNLISVTEYKDSVHMYKCKNQKVTLIMLIQLTPNNS